jgi:ribonucleoside-diphosphate reductase beta chain
MSAKGGIGGLGVSADEALSNGSELFEYPDVLDDYVGGYYQSDHQLTSATSKGPFEFGVLADGKHYIILPLTRLSGKIQIVNEDGTKLTKPLSNHLGVVNLMPDSLFNHVDITVNNTKVSDSTSNCYGYKAFIETQLSYGEEAKKTHLRASIYYDDTAGHYNSSLLANKGRDDRSRQFTKSGIVEFETSIHCDFFKIYRYLPNNCDISIKFHRHLDTFSLFNSVENTVKFKIKITDLLLSVRKVELHPDVLSSNNRLFKQNKLAVLPIYRNQIKTFLIPSGVGSHIIPHAISGQLPRSVIIGLVTCEAFDGNQFQNPFNFAHFNLKRISLIVDGRSVPARPYEMDYDKDYFMRPYRAMFDGVGIYSDNTGNAITPKLFKSGNAFYVFDLTPDCCSGEHEHQTEIGMIEISLTFKNSLSKAIKVIAYSSYTSKIFINGDGDITTDYIV